MILSETQTMIRDAVRDMARERIAPHAAAWEAAGAYPPDLFKDLADLGLMGMTAPAEHGGAEADYVSYALALMELAAADGGVSTVVSVHNAPVVAALLRNGTDAQKAAFLPRLCAGEIIGAFALTEPGAGSDASALKTRAVRDGDDWRIDGTKQFITSGRIGGLTIVFAVTDPTAGKRGLSAFLVPADTPGLTVAKPEHKMGQKASDTCALSFDDMRISDSLRLGAEGDGYRIALANLETGRIGIAAQSVGMARAALEIAVAYAKERVAFGKAILEHQAVGFRLADLAARLEAAQQLVLHAASLKDAGLPCLTEASMAKLVASELAEVVVSGAIQTLGGYGYLEEYGLAKIYRDVRVCQIYEGTSDIQRMVIARAL
ncbi:MULTISPECIES: acyl-CoA dehydrogenase family protein [unclassified Brevundimonas]|uniref:acyl-CoA dehydrogenase family protein n=1 Tax=unclassified Brevundimonas TaxID=2622653 RepID=UPI000E986A20|nr:MULTISPECIES: acyl-CoA dehydrogenase family protein [unclassified Brevundimonas]MCK6104053.1 acyl-CoA dehydrogenase family protein [Brevundimonas sp. EYE_349]HBI20551.1 acyl-CoA dehydrogenase [Brevundimonas sp.]